MLTNWFRHNNRLFPFGIMFEIRPTNLKPIKMKKILFLFVFGVFTLTISAQKSAIIVFSEDGEAFDLMINGEKKNDAPSTNVKVLNINEGNYRLVVKFQNAQIPNVTQSAMVEPGLEYTFALKRNKKGVMVMRYFGDAPYNATADSKPEPAREVKVTVNEEQARPTSTVSATGGETVNISTTVTEESMTKPTTAGVSMNISADGANMGISMKVEGMEMEPTTTNVTTTVTTSSTTTTSSSGGYVETETTQDQGGTYIVGETSTSTGGCKGRSSMTSTSFQSALESIQSKSFEDTKITTIKQIVKANCISVAQLSEIIKLLTFEESKVTIAKFAYDYVSDTNNYFQINDLFTYSSSVDELNEYLESK